MILKISKKIFPKANTFYPQQMSLRSEQHVPESEPMFARPVSAQDLFLESPKLFYSTNPSSADVEVEEIDA